MNEGRRGDWIQTYRGRFWVLDPRPEDVNIEDLAHHLANICRFSGACNVFYSVAQHSVLVSNLVRTSQELAGLFHDAAEAYIGDINTPLKRSLSEGGYIPGDLGRLVLGYLESIEHNISSAIFEHFQITKYNRQEVKKADMIALYMEKRDLMAVSEVWGEEAIYNPLLSREKIIPLSYKDSERLFLQRYEGLRK